MHRVSIFATPETVSTTELGFDRCGRDCSYQRRNLLGRPSDHPRIDFRQYLDLQRLWRCRWRHGLDTGALLLRVLL